MAMTPPRKHLAIAIDGGGAKGLIVAQALIALEDALGGKPLIEYPNLNILTGTSTGAIIAASIAVGMKANEIIDFYLKAGQIVFPPLSPEWLPSGIRSLIENVRGIFSSHLYPNQPLKQIIRDHIGKYTGNPDLTLGELNKRLSPGQGLVITAVDLLDRRTHFIKSYQAADADWKLWEVVLASSSGPVVMPPYERNGIYYSDGGVGSFGNPAYIAAREASEWSRYQPEDVSVFSFGTGWLTAKTYEKAVGKPSDWNLIRWAMNAPIVMIADAARSQSLDIVNDYMQGEDKNKWMDFRRFQIQLEQDFPSYAPTPEGNKAMIEVGTKLGQQIINNQHALGDYPGFDPEGLRDTIERYRCSYDAGGAPSI